MLKEELIILPQEQEGDYLFVGEDVRTICTKNFLNKFGEHEAKELAFASQYLISETYENPDYLQRLSYKGTEFYVIGEFHRGDKPEDYIDTPYLYITLMLKEDY